MLRIAKARQYSRAIALAALSGLTATGPARAATTDPTGSLTGKASGLTSDQVAKKATATSFAAAEKRHEVEAAVANVRSALYDFLPRLNVSASYFRLSKLEASPIGNVVVAPGAAAGPLAPGQQLVAAPIQFDGPRNATTFSAAFTLPLSDYVFRLCQSRDSAKAQLEGSQLLLEATRRKVAYDARALYYDWVRAELNAVVAAQNLSLGEEHLSRLQAMAAADSAAPADVARVEATVAASEQVLAQARNLAALQMERVAIAMHDSTRRDYQIGEDLSAAPSERGAPNEIAQLTLLAEQRRPELKGAQLKALAYEKGADAGFSRVLPRLDAIAQGTFANPNQRYFPPADEFHTSWQVGVQLSLSPTDNLIAKSQVRMARELAAGALAERGQLLDAVRMEVAEAVLAERTAQAGLKSSARRLSAAETSYRSRRERFQVGQATTVELTEAQTELFNARLDAIQAQVAIRLARARIAYVTGS
jgi:outer membrane protein TolC